MPEVIEKIEIQITTACNMQCSFCFADAGNFSTTIDAKTAFSKIANAHRGNHPAIKLRDLWLTGGEPLLEHKLCLELIHCAREIGLHTGIATNGLLLAEKAKELNLAGLNSVRISLDAANPVVFDRMRGTHCVFSKVIKGIETAAASGLKTGIRYTATRYNSHEMEAVIRIARETGASSVEVKAVLPIGRGSASIMLDPFSLKKIMEKALEMSTPETPVFVLCSYLPPCHGFSTRAGYIPCVCATSSLYVSVDGSIMPCSYFPHTSPFNIKTHSLQVVWYSKYFSQVRDLRPIDCNTCKTWEPCRNGCPAVLANYASYSVSCYSLIESIRKGQKYGPIYTNG